VIRVRYYGRVSKALLDTFPDIGLQKTKLTRMLFYLLIKYGFIHFVF
jgi:hypothetical protein